MAAKAGVQGVVLSNHGGRQLDFAPSGVEILVEVVQKLKSELGMTLPNPNFQIFVDGGVRRATDVLKAVALGATAGKWFSLCLLKIKTHSYNSRYRTTIPICFLRVWSGWGRPGLNNFACSW